MKKIAVVTVLACAAMAGSIPAFAQGQSNFERNQRDVNREYDRQQAEKTRESMRDKTHDGPGRYRDGDTSVGVTGADGKPAVDIRHTY